jgi:valyl-tRNA synthetase
MLHPFIPFVTEGIWRELAGPAARRGLRAVFDAEPALVTASWPAGEASLRSLAVESEMDRLQGLIRSLRDIRAEVNDYRGRAGQPSLKTLGRAIVRADADTCRLIETHRAFILPLAGCEVLEAGTAPAKPDGSMGRLSSGLEVYAPVSEVVDLSEVRRGETAKLEELRRHLAREEARTSNVDFVRRADPAVVEQARARCAELSSQIRRVEQHLAELA